MDLRSTISKDFNPETVLWIPAAGYGERCRPYTYLRAKAALPLSAERVELFQYLTGAFHLSEKIDAAILTTYYRPYDFKKHWGAVQWTYLGTGEYGCNWWTLNNRTWNMPWSFFQTDVLHNTACDFDMLRWYFPSIRVFYVCLGDLVVADRRMLHRLVDPPNALIVSRGKVDFANQGVLHLTSGHQWFNEKQKGLLGDLYYRWRGILKFSVDTFSRPLHEPRLCKKSDRNPNHDKSFQEVYMKEMIGGNAYFDPIVVEESDIVNVGTKESYEQFRGLSETELLDELR